MNALRTFFYVWKSSFSSTDYYKDVLKAPFSFSLKYFLFFCFLLSIVLTIFFVAKLFSPLNSFLTRFPRVLVNSYPAELEVKIRNGELSTNAQEPYFIPVERLERSFEEFDKEVKGLQSDKIINVMVVDTNASVEDLERYQTYALLTKKNLVYYKDDGRIEVVSLSDIDNLTINQGMVKGLLNRFLPVLRIIGIALIPFVFVGSFIFFSLFNLVYLLFTAVVLFLGAKLIKHPVSFLKSYQIDLHLATIIIPFFLLLNLFNVEVNFPLLKIIVFTMIGLFILNSLKVRNLSPVKAKKQSRRS